MPSPLTQSPGDAEQPTRALEPDEAPTILAPTSTGARENAPSTRPANPMPLPEFPGYVVHRRLGGGGMGEVYEATNLLGKRVALKLIRPDRDDPEFFTRFRNEAAALQDLNHPHIARIFEYNEHQGVPYFTMRLLTGGTLTQRLAEFRSDTHKAVELVAVLAEAVGYIHRRNLLHRDLKPSNILFDDEGQPHVSDFGLVKGLDSCMEDLLVGGPGEPVSEVSTLTSTGQAIGTLPYMSPEQFRGAPTETGPWSDVWALGVILYELLAGQRPFTGDDAETIRSRIRTVEPIPPVQLNPHLDGDLERIVLRCLTKEPAGRYESAQALAVELRAWLSQQPHTYQSPPRRPIWTWLAVGILATAVALPGWWLWRPDPRERLIQKLHQGHEVGLIGDRGQPAYARTAVAPAGSTPSYVAADGLFTIDTIDLVLIELVPPESCPHGYRLRAQVRLNHEEPGIGRAGIYVGHTTRPSPGEDHFFAEYSFTDDLRPLGSLDEPLPPAGQLRGDYALLLRRFLNEPGEPRYYPSFSTRLRNVFHHAPAAPGKEAAWRDLEIEMTKDRVHIRWQNGAAQTLSSKTVANNARIFFGKSVQPPPSFGPEGGAGLVAYRANVSFRSVNVTPLPAP